MVSNALEEAHVVQATGPCAYAAAFLNVFGISLTQPLCVLPPSPSLYIDMHIDR